MPRARIGTLVPPTADGIWRARVTKTKTLPNGRELSERPLYSLGTTDKALARRKLAKLVAALEAGHDVLDATESANAPERVKDYASAWHTKREAQGVVMAPQEWRYLEIHVLPSIGHLPLCDVTAGHVRAVLDDLAMGTYRREGGPERPYRQQMIAHVRAAMHRVSTRRGGRTSSSPTPWIGCARRRCARCGKSALS
ncbi:MAG TPA: hypothetical protein VGM06_08305 [Polyangiaceae bacterium]|jgi:hypothetical protein